MFIFYLLIGVAVLLALYMAGRGFVTASPHSLAIALRWSAAIGGGAVALWLILSGRAGQAIMLATALAPLFVRWKSLWTQFKNRQGPTPGQRSDIETAWLRMTLDHDSFALDGVILKGPHRGRRVGELTLAQLLDLLAECRIDDADSAAILETYLDRLAPEWREAAGGTSGAPPPRAAPSAAMTRDEACRILGLAPGADEAAIRAAHKRLMKKLHPDQGGSDYLAAKINQAKDLLLGS